MAKLALLRQTITVIPGIQWNPSWIECQTPTLTGNHIHAFVYARISNGCFADVEYIVYDICPTDADGFVVRCRDSVM